jgi:hypothetical protein
METSNYGLSFNLDSAKRTLEIEISRAKDEFYTEGWSALAFLNRIEGLVSIIPNSTQFQSVDFGSPAIINITC